MLTKSNVTKVTKSNIVFRATFGQPATHINNQLSTKTTGSTFDGRPGLLKWDGIYVGAARIFFGNVGDWLYRASHIVWSQDQAADKLNL